MNETESPIDTAWPAGPASGSAARSGTQTAPASTSPGGADAVELDAPGWIARSARRIALWQLAALVVLPPLFFLVRALDVTPPERMVAGMVAWFTCSVCFAAACWLLVLRHHVNGLARAEGHWRTMALVDALTGLPNRDGLRTRLLPLLRQHAAAGRRRNRPAVLVLDVDRFRLINESAGQERGDQILRAVAARLVSLVDESHTVARLGGDQFAILCPAMQGASAATALARNILRGVQGGHTLPGYGSAVSLSCSIGIMLASPDDSADTPDEWLTRADAALRAAKARGGHQVRVYEPSMFVDAQRRLDTEVRLRDALAGDQFRLVFQPIVSADGRRVIGFESLLRWNDPVHGPVSPADFIPILEQSGLIADVGRWVLEESCRQAAVLLARTNGSLMMSVNVSPLQFAQPDFVSSVMVALRRAQMPATCLQLEVTEGLLLDPTEATLQRIAELAAAGIRLAIDDFGMGYSSLAYLRRFRLHSLKIDRAFVQQAAEQDRDAAVVRAMVELGHALGLSVTAEGVETEAQHTLLRRLGCDNMQGFLFGRPMPPEAALRCLVEGLAAAPAEPADAPAGQAVPGEPVTA